MTQKIQILQIQKLLLAACAILIVNLHVNCQTIAINEFVASNETTICDEDGDYEDWIEFYNYGDDPINMLGFWITDNPDIPDKWSFPEIVIAPGEFYVIFASGKNRTEGEYLHTNFSISKDGETLVLSNCYGQVIDYVLGMYLNQDFSAGRNPDGIGEFVVFENPSPGFSNSGTYYDCILPPVAFSSIGGFYTNNFFLSLTHPDPDAVILYTLDGSIPNPENLEGSSFIYKNSYYYLEDDSYGEALEQSFLSNIYNQAILLKDRTSEPNRLSIKSSTFYHGEYSPNNNIYKANCIRAVAIKEGCISSNIATNTYFISETGREKYSLPVISISIPEVYMYGYEDGIYTAGIDADNYRAENPETFTGDPNFGNFTRRGDTTEVVANFEYFPKNHISAVINQQVGLRMHGGYSRSFPCKTFRVYARNEYGNASLDENFFNNDYDSYKRLLLRNSGNDWGLTLFRDAMIHELVRNMNFDTQEYQASIVFVNSEYWGIHNIRERYDKHYLNRMYNLHEDEIDYLANWEAVEGSYDNYSNLLAFVEQNDMQIEENYEFIKSIIDIENYVDYQIAEIYVGNYDWPGNNYDRFRKKIEIADSTGEFAHDGKWRWLFYDADYGFQSHADIGYNYNMLEHATETENQVWPNPASSTLLFRRLLTNDEFKNQFIDRFEYHLLTTFSTERTISIIDSLGNIISPQILEHSNRWHRGGLSMSNWNSKVNTMKFFAQQRPCAMRNMLIEFFEIDNPDYAASVCGITYEEEIMVKNYDVELFPNPANDYIIVKIENFQNTVNTISIYDMFGREMQTLALSNNSEITNINIENIVPGNYFCVIKNQVATKTLRFVKL